MASQTPNYNLNKIDLTDAPPDITVLNSNFDTIDTQLKTAQQAAAAVETSLTSHTGDTNNPHSVTAEQVGARPNTWLPTAAEVGAVPTSRTVNGKALSADIALSAADVGAAASSHTHAASDITSGVTNNTGTSSSITGSTNLLTMNTLRYALNRTTSVGSSDTDYTTYMARGTALKSSEATPSYNGQICWVYE